ncbi:MAG: hypothetical protein IPJ03_15165 [Ignavibacteriales bacterium]|nr:hypothetical protein [Ignavibacteriales bacterium]
MKKIIIFVLKAIAHNIIQLIFGLIIIWLGIPALFPSLKQYSWDLLENLFSIKVNLGIILLVILSLVILYYLLQKFVLRKYIFKEYNGLLWKVNKKTLEVDNIPYCLKHHAELVDRYIPQEEFSYMLFYCPICGKDFKPKITDYDINNLYSEAKSVIQSKYNR